MTQAFDYSTAFRSNIGWVSREEQAVLKTRCIAIAGLGGVGGSHLLTLARLGIGRFHLSDFDHFELHNFNRQAGASLPHLGQQKLDVAIKLAREINPELEITGFPEGICESNVDAFLEGVDLYVDGLDFFALQARRAVFSACTQRGVPAVTAAPLGMGTAVLNFLPGKMTFEEYFCLEGHDENEQLLRFLLGISPAMLQGNYLVDPGAVDLPGHRGPSTAMACELCSGMAATQALKILLGRGPVPAAPHGLHFDAYRNQFRKTWRPGGNQNPLQRLGLAIARKRFGAQLEGTPRNSGESRDDALMDILDLGRWAPSGDNTQPWRFERLGELSVRIHGFDTRSHCVYDLDGRASQLSIGALLATLRIAASGKGMDMRYKLIEGGADSPPLLDVDFRLDDAAKPDPLWSQIRLRSVQRRALSTLPLTPRERARLEAAVAPEYRVVWLEGLASRWRMAKLLSRNGKLRLTLPEAYPTHRDIIAWRATESETRIPDRAVGADILTLRLMRWTLGSWERVSFMNRYLAGTLVPRIQLDLLPAMACGAHFALVARKPPADTADYLDGGEALQRFWLTASDLNLQLQPEMTPLIFSRYIREERPFTRDTVCERLARDLAVELDHIMSEGPLENIVFMGRIGAGQRADSRSTRLSLEQLMTTA